MEPDPLLGKKLGAYLIQNKIGEGGMSFVYKGYHARLRRDVAIKVISSEIAASSDFRARFEREAQLIASLQHPNIVTIYDFGESDNITYLVMQYVNGGTLRDRLSNGQPIEPRRAASYALQMAQALHHAHLHGIVHRDVKPQNMLVSANDPNTLLLSDFGIAKLFDSSHEATWTGAPAMDRPADHSVTNVGQLVGTAEYMAPEQVNQKVIDARTDVYALGVVLFQMLTGKVPFQSSSLEGLLFHQAYTVPPSIRKINPKLPEPLAQITARALAKSPAERFQSADIMAQALETIVSSTTTIYTTSPGGDHDPLQQNKVAHSSDTCPNCGIVLDSDGGFCANCGYYLFAKFSQHEQTQISIEQPKAQGLSLHQAIDNFPTIQNLSAPIVESKPTKDSSPKKCPFCGAETRPGDNFCLNCGNRLLPTGSSPRQAQPLKVDSTLSSVDPWVNSSYKRVPERAVTRDGTDPAVLETSDRIENPAHFVVRNDKGEFLQEYRLEKLETVIGRAASSDISLEKDRLTSRRHAIVRYENGHYVLYDERSGTGTFVNGRELEELTPHSLKDGDRVSIGEHELIFQALTTSGAEDFARKVEPEHIGEGTIGTRFMLTAESPYVTAPDTPATPPEVQLQVEESISFTPDATSDTRPDSTFALDLTIAQLLEEGENHYKAKHYEDALAIYKHIIRLDPRNIDAHGNKGNILGRLRQYKEALAAYDAALGINAKHVSIWNARGDVLFKLRHYEEALKAYNAALSINPDQVLTLTTKGEVLSRLRRYEEALTACNQALNLTPTYTHTWITKGTVYSKQRRYEEALVAYDAALVINSKDASTWTVKGNILTKLGRYEESLVAYTCASDLAPRKPQIWAAKGEVLLQLKRYDEALIAYERSHILNPNDTAILRKCILLRDLKRHKDELARAQAKKEPAEAEAVAQSTTIVIDDNEPVIQRASHESLKDQELDDSFEQEANSTRVFEYFDIFISYSELDAKWVEWVENKLASRLEDEHGFRVWLPKWWLIPGMPWETAWDSGMDQSRCYAICVGKQTSMDWFKQEVQRAIRRKQEIPSFRVLIVLLPDAREIDVDVFPELTTWVDFRNLDHSYAFHVLVCGVKGIPPGPPPKPRMETTDTWTGMIAEVRLRELQQFKQGKLIDDSVAQEFQRIILKKAWLDIDETKG